MVKNECRTWGVLTGMSYIQPTRHHQRSRVRGFQGSLVQRDATACPRSLKPIAWTTFLQTKQSPWHWNRIDNTLASRKGINAAGQRAWMGASISSSEDN